MMIMMNIKIKCGFIIYYTFQIDTFDLIKSNLGEKKYKKISSLMNSKFTHLIQFYIIIGVRVTGDL
jgi:hypothetical protein